MSQPIVLYIQDHANNAGSQQSLLMLAKSIKNLGYQPVVVVCEDGWLTDKLSECSIQTEIIKLPAWRKPFERLTNWSYISRLKTILLKYKPSIIHSNEIWVNPYAVRASKLNYSINGLRASVICHIRDTHIDIKKIKNYLVEQSDIVISISKSLSDKIISAGLLPQKVKILSNPVDIELFSPKPIDSSPDNLLFSNREMPRGFDCELNVSEKLKTSQIKILCIGKVCKRKGQDILLDAAKALIEKGYLISVLLVGEADKRELARLSCQKQGNFWRYYGPSSDVPNLIRESDIVAIPSIEEAFGRIAIEAMACAKPVIASDTGGLAEIIQNEQTGLLFPVGNSSILAEKIDKIIKDDKFAISIGRAAREEMVNKYSLPIIAEKLADIYNQCKFLHTSLFQCGNTEEVHYCE